MRLSFLLLFALALSTQVQAQSYNSPESVDYDPVSNRYFISNTNTSQILARNSNNGELSVFATLNNAPYGLEVVGTELYACSGSGLRIFNLSTGEETAYINMGLNFPNGITHKNNNIFLTDFSNNRIYRYNITNGNYNVYIDNFPSTPNGIFYDDIADRLLVVSWGNNAPIYEINVSDSSHTVAANTTLGYLDGISMDNNGDFYFSAWSSNSIHKFTSDFVGAPTIVANSMSSPADIYYNRSVDTLAIPNSGNNTVVFLGFESPNTIQEVYTTKVYPNPLTAGSTLSIEKDGNYQLLNQEGKLIWKGASTNKQLKLPNLQKGVYILKNTDYLAKLIIQ